VACFVAGFSANLRVMLEASEAISANVSA
jgi:hypothetical protein